MKNSLRDCLVAGYEVDEAQAAAIMDKLAYAGLVEESRRVPSFATYAVFVIADAEGLTARSDPEEEAEEDEESR